MPSSFASVKNKFSASSTKLSSAFQHNRRLNPAETFTHPEWEYRNHELIKGIDTQERYNSILNKRLDQVSEKRPLPKSKTGLPSPKNRHYLDDGRKLRADAVCAFEVVLSYNRDKLGWGANRMLADCPLDYDATERTRWEDVSLKWAKEYFKNPVTGENNILSATVHYDEANPHIHLIVMPMNGAKLDQNKWLGGARAMAMLTAKYSKLMSKEFGLRMEHPESRAKHKDVTEMHSRHQELRNSVEPIKVSDFKSPEEAIEFANEVIKDLHSQMFRMEIDHTEALSKKDTEIANPNLYRQVEMKSLQNENRYLIEQNNELIRTFNESVESILKCQMEVEHTNDAHLKELALEELLSELMDIQMIRNEIETREKEEKEREKEKNKRKKNLLDTLSYER